MSLTSQQQYELKKFIKELEKHKGRHTEFVSVYVPEGYDMNKIMNHLAQEQGTASNIKSSATRKNVTDALERMIQHLRVVGRTPLHGLAVFSGNVTEREGQQDFRVWSIEPPIPLKTRIYRCDKEFQLDLLREMLEAKELYAMVVMDRREGDLAYLKGKSIIPVASTKSNVPGKTRAGGQSSARFMRLREDAAKEFYKKIGRMMTEEFFKKENLKGILVGGPGPTKYDFVDGDFITNDLKKKIIAIKDLSYTGSFGLQELLERCEDVLAQEEVIEEKKLVGKFLLLLATKPGMVVYGEQETMQHVQNGTVDTLLLSEELDEQLMEKFEEEAKKLGTVVKIISTETREGIQLRDIGRIAAILRYEIHE
ncbi:peptide chain release factor aRF-1 [Candidatus Woesearchaeota archaeon]|nr:peptide chain release factor aRF-1 [Candidatus Woesearchaeota archaeon]